MSRPIRLFVDAHLFDGPYQGTRSFLQGLYTELAQDPGVELYFGARDCSGLQQQFAAVAERIHFVPYRSRSRYRRLLWELPAILTTSNMDYAHFQYVAPPRKVCPYIVTTHDLLFEEFPGAFPSLYRQLRSHWFRLSARRADILSTVSAYAAASIERRYGIPAAGISILPNSVTPLNPGPVERAAARERLRQRYGVHRYLLCVSRREPRKNLQLLVDSFRKQGLAAQGYQLVLIGARSLPVPALDAAIGRLTASERAALFLLENIPATELQDWYLGTELFLYPSLGEGFGIPPLEAAAAQVPVLCSNRTALADFDFFGPDHLDPNQEIAFAERMVCLLQKPTPQKVLEERAHEVRVRYSWKNSARILLHRIRAHRAQNGLA